MSVLSIKDLHVTFPTPLGDLRAVRGINLDVEASELMGVVGESGSGKSVTFLAAMGLLPAKARVTGSVTIDGQELIGASAKTIRSVRGKSMSMIFQDPLSALNPVHRVGDQIVEMIQAHSSATDADAWKRAIELLDIVGIPQPDERASQYPH
ncbi:MAG: ATP-binding cassette domain-containing protein, partial [Ilumatobacteraceae bacterium]